MIHARDLPENVTLISSGCIISEAIAAIEVWMSILHRIQLWKWRLTFVFGQLEIFVTHLRQCLEALRRKFFLLLLYSEGV
jgi:hypothetical protein